MDEDYDEGTGEDHLINLSFSLASDGKYLRRTCPDCGLDFKTETSPEQYASMLNPAIQRVGREYGIDLATEGGSSDESSELHCPYCGSASPQQDTHTEETVSVIHRIAYREIIAPMVREMFSGMDDIDGGMISISFSGGNTPLPPRPIHGPEPEDLCEVRYSCCRQGAKINAKWLGLVTCPYCGRRAVTW